MERLELFERNMGFGSLAKVLEPASLMKEIKDDLGKSLKSYAKLSGSSIQKK
jgi:predicted DNA-binding transcriptional regulator YafY